jgi:serine/threonine protein kinase
MTPIERIESLFHQARALPAGVERRQWVDEQCGNDRETAAQLLALLDSDQAISHLPGPVAAAEPPVPTAQFGAYRAVELLGRGGMSAVYKARRSDGRFEQTVALKIMAGYLAGPEFLRRFELERQLLATLSHNHITRLLDGGVSSAGDPYLITEYVEGRTIDQYCDEEKLDVAARLRLFLQVCEAVDHAHRNRIVHLDLKPANILVDSEGSVKLLDFGTAALAAPGKSSLTAVGLLTPRYASPEQLRGQPVGAATDVFSLGVVLYEMVTGAWPFGDPASALSELCRAVGDAPVRPPTGVVTAEAARSRSTPVDRLRHMLRGDLSAILIKALEDDATRRYESVTRFAADVRHFLEHRPVSARRQTAWYRARKFHRRHRVAVTAAALLFLFVAASAAFLYQVRLRNEEQERHAAGLSKIVTQASLMITEHIQKSQLELAREEELSLRESLEQEQRDNPDNPLIWNLLGSAYMQLGQLEWFRYGPSFMDRDRALDSYGRARAFFEKMERRHAAGALDQSVAARMYESEMLIETGRGWEAFREVVQLLRDDEAALPSRDSRSFGSVGNLASYYDMLSDRLGGNMAWPEEDADAPGWRRALAALQPSRMTNSIAMTLYRAVLTPPAGAGPEAIPERGGAIVRLQLGRLQLQVGMREAGWQSLREALRAFSVAAATTHDSGYVLDHLAGAHIQLSRAAEAEGKFAEALREREQAMACLDKLAAPQPRSLYQKERVGGLRLASARLLNRLGRRAEALREGQAGLRDLRENAAQPRAAALTLDLAAQRLLTAEPLQLRDPAQAREYARRAVDQTAATMPPYLVTLAFAELAMGHQEAARQTARSAVEGYRKVGEILKPLFDSSRYPEAASLYREWRKQLEQLPDLH